MGTKITTPKKYRRMTTKQAEETRAMLSTLSASPIRPDAIMRFDLRYKDGKIRHHVLYCQSLYTSPDSGQADRLADAMVAGHLTLASLVGNARADYVKRG